MAGLAMDSLYGEQRSPSPADVSAEESLRAITGIGPTIAKKLAAMGVTVEQIAGWNYDDIDRIDAEFKIKNHGAEDWPDMAMALLERSAAAPAGDPEDEDEDEETPPPSAPAPRRAPPPAPAARHKTRHQMSQQPKAAQPARQPRRIRHRLDPNRKVSDIVGQFPEYPGAAYVQDGRYFGNNKLEIMPGGAEGDFEVEPEVPLNEQSKLHAMDLTAWRDGRVEYPFPAVRKAIRERFGGREVASQAAARHFLRTGQPQGGNWK